MAINTQLPLGVQPMQIENPVNQLAKVLQIKDMQQGQQMNALKMDEYRRSVEDGNALRSALGQPGADPYKLLIERGRVKEATDFAKGKADIGKTEAEAKYKQIETAHKRVDLAGQTMGWLRQNPSLENAQLVVRHLVSNGGMDQAEGQGLLAQLQANPQGIAQFAEMTFRSALAAKDQLAKFQTNNIGGQTVTQGIDPVTGKASMVSAVQNTQSPDNAASNARMAADNAAARAVQMRGQNLTDARSRESNQQGRVPAGYRQKADGSLEFIPGGPADPNAAKRAAPTEFQGKAGMFGNRAAEADRIITELQGSYSPTAINTKQALGNVWGVGGALEAGSNLMLSDQSQKAEQAQRDFVNAVLRLESGAAIAESEFNNAKKQYFPQPGDAPAVIAQKASNRKLAIQGLMNNSRPGGVEPRASGGGRSVSGVVHDEQPRVIDFGSLK
jgi:hypothetical protein